MLRVCAVSSLSFITFCILATLTLLWLWNRGFTRISQMVFLTLTPEWYSIIRHDRSISNGCGVCVFIRKALEVILVNLDMKYEHLELICFDLVNKKHRTPTRIFLAYRPPSTNDLAVSYLYQLIECLNTYQNKSFVNIITGHLNLPKIDWYQLFSPSDKLHQPFFEFATDNGFIQVVNFTTRGSNLLDIVLIDDVLRILEV